MDPLQPLFSNGSTFAASTQLKSNDLIDSLDTRTPIPQVSSQHFLQNADIRQWLTPEGNETSPIEHLSTFSTRGSPARVPAQQPLVTGSESARRNVRFARDDGLVQQGRDRPHRPQQRRSLSSRPRIQNREVTGETEVGISNASSSSARSARSNTIIGSHTRDRLIPTGQQFVYGRRGKDTVDASQSSGGNQIYGGRGKDTLTASQRDQLYGNQGRDRLFSIQGSSNQLRGGWGRDRLWAGHRDQLMGGRNRDRLDASQGRGLNQLYGRKGKDRLFAHHDDRLFGGPGRDRLWAGQGRSVLHGGRGRDIFWIINSALPEDSNKILDFQQGRDRIGIENTNLPTVSNFEALDLQQRGNDTVIRMRNQDVAVLCNVVADSLTADDFIFRPHKTEPETVFGANPAISVRLQNDTGLSSSDRLTRQPDITGSIRSDAAITQFQARFDRGTTTSFVDVLPSVQADKTFTFNHSQLDAINGGPLADGIHTLQLQVTNDRGDEGDESVVTSFRFTLDRSTPAITASLANDLGADTEDNLSFDPTIAGKITDLSQITSFRARIEDRPTVEFSDILDSVQPDGQFQITQSQLEAMNQGPFADGNHTLILEAEDEHGNGIGSLAFSFTIDATEPVAILDNTPAIGRRTIDIRYSEEVDDTAFETSGYQLTKVGIEAADNETVAIASVQKLDDRTARLTLSQPQPSGYFELAIQPTIHDLAGNIVSGTNLLPFFVEPSEDSS